LQRSGALTLSRVAIPESTLLTNVILVLAASLAIAICAQITIRIEPVPVSLQTFAVLTAGTVLGSKRGALAVLAYIGEGLVGLPVFANLSSAWSVTRFNEYYIFGSTLGYLIGFVAAAFVCGFLAERFAMDRKAWSTVLLMVAGNVVLYIPGLIWLSFWLSWHAGTYQAIVGTPIPGLLLAGVIPFLAGDVIKLLFAAVAVPSLWELPFFRGSR
jgi:biotin transport system substrate-specific component